MPLHIRDIMPFRTVPFRDLLHGVARRAGMVPEEDGIDRGPASIMAECLTSALRFAWNAHDWEECTLTNPFPVTVSGGRSFIPRRVPDTWDGSGVRTAGWDILTVRAAWTADPYAPDADACQIKFTPSASGIMLAGDYTNGDLVWLQYAIPPPIASSRVWEPTATYRRGDVVIGEDGELYRCMVENTITGSAPVADNQNWDWFFIPEIFSEAVKAGAFALYTLTEGQTDTAAALSNAMVGALEAEMLRKSVQENQYRTYRK